MIEMIYFRPTDDRCTALDGKLFDLAARHRGQARLVVRHSSESGMVWGGWVSGQAPTTLFMSNGRCVAEMVGDLPLPQIERLLSSSLLADGVAGEQPLARAA
jgi:thioredoxin-like negative regulator of GroEL